MSKNKIYFNLHWLLCGQAARLLDWLMMLSLVGVGLVFLIDGDVLFLQQSYSKFSSFSNESIALGIFIVVIIQLFCSLSKNDFALAFGRFIGGGGFAVMFSAFFGAYPPANIGMVFTLIFSITAFLSAVIQARCGYIKQACENLCESGLHE